MVLGILGLLTVTSIPTVTGVGQAVSAQKRQNAESKEQEKINLAAKFSGENPLSDEQATCFLKDGKVSAFGTQHPLVTSSELTPHNR